MFAVTSTLRLLPVLLLGCLPAVALADTAQPAGVARNTLEPPPPPAIDGSDDSEPEVTITKKTGETVEEYRIGGRLYMIKITPSLGAPYYLVDDRGDGRFARQDSLDTGFRPPRWIIKKF